MPGRLIPRLVCCSWFDGKDGGVLAREDAVRFVTQLLKDPEVTLVGQNMAFDMAVVVAAGVDINLVFDEYNEGRIQCTMIFEKLRKIALGWLEYDPNQRCRPKFSLAALVQEYLGETLTGKTGDDIWRLRYRELEGVPVEDYPETAHNYALSDAKYTWRVDACQRERTPDLPDYLRQCAYAWALHLTSSWGMRTDKGRVLALEKRVSDEVNNAVANLTKVGIYRPNGKKNLAILRAFIIKAYGEENVPMTDKGAIKTDADTLKQANDPTLQMLADISEADTILTTFVPALLQGVDVPVTPQYDLVKSGRTSSYKPNIQNQPREGGVRECFIPRTGYGFLSCDYSIAELCSLAQVLLDRYGASSMAESLIAGRELHLETAAGILGLSYKVMEEKYRAKEKAAKDARQLAKAANFGFPGGLGADTFIDYARTTFNVDINRAQAVALKEAWMERYPEMSRYFRDIGDLCNAGGGSFTAEQHRSGRLRGDCTFCSGCNTFFQGLTADGAKLGLYEVTKACYTNPDSPLWGSHPVAFIHDEIIVETPLDRADAAAAELSRIMVQSMETFTPDIPAKAEAALMMRWYKGAEPVRDAAGKLIPWTPKSE